jgi:hypothetical protein
MYNGILDNRHVLRTDDLNNEQPLIASELINACSGQKLRRSWNAAGQFDLHQG